MKNILLSIERSIAKNYRKNLSKQAFIRHNGTVQRGAFTGMQLEWQANVSKAALGLKIYGLYESPVISLLASWSPAEILIDIGGGDGYFPVGMLRAGMVTRAVVFEKTQDGRNAIKRNAELNGVADKVKIFGEADDNIVGLLENENIDPSSTLLLCDIEGGEFSVINERITRFLSGTRYIIELHDNLMQDPPPGIREDLISKFPENYQTRTVTDQPRQWNGIPDLEEMHDIDRALITSEGRKCIGEWLVATMH